MFQYRSGALPRPTTAGDYVIDAGSCLRRTIFAGRGGTLHAIGLNSKLFDFDRSAGHHVLATRTLQQSAIEFVLICNFDNARNELQAARGNVVTFTLDLASDRIRS